MPATVTFVEDSSQDLMPTGLSETLLPAMVTFVEDSSQMPYAMLEETLLPAMVTFVEDPR